MGSFTPQLSLDHYLKVEDSPFKKGEAENSAVLKGGDNKTTNVNETAFGRLNKSNENTRFSIGIGTDNTNRKNAVEVTDEGEVYIKGIGSYDGTNIGSSKDLSFAFNELPFIREGIGYGSIKYGEGSIAGLYYTKIYLRGIDYANNKVYLSADETADIVTSNFSEVFDAKIDLSPYLNNHVFFIHHDGTLGQSFVTQTKGNILYLSNLRSDKVLSNKVYSKEPIRINNFLYDASQASAFQGCSAVSGNSHAEGKHTLALGYGSHTEGVATIATNTAEHAEGKYNKSNVDTIHSVGIGASTAGRKNAHEIMQDGKHYIYGVGGYDGTNPDGSKDVATTLTTLDERIGEIENKQEKVFILPEDFLEEEYNEPDEDGANGKVKQEYVTDILENRYNKINIDGILGDIDITDDFIIIRVKYEGFQTGQKQESYTEMFIRVQDCKFTQQIYLNTSPFVTPLFSTDAADINGDIRYNFVTSVTDEEITIPEENKQLFKKNMGSFADWNAKEGEAGYIENKPFYIEQINIDKNDIVWEDSMDETIAHVQLTQLGTITIYFEDVTDGIFGPLILNEQNEYRGEISASDSFWGVYVNTDNYVLTLKEYNLTGSEIVSITQEVFKQLDSKYLPNTVVKTTPQTLSDDAKNQVLSNLGIQEKIDEMVNNIPIEYGTAIDETTGLPQNSMVLKGTNKGTATGNYSVSLGWQTKAIGPYTLAVGQETEALGYYSNAEGYQTISKGGGSHAEGANTKAYGSNSHAEGQNTEAGALDKNGETDKSKGNGAHAEGQDTKSIGDAAHAEGCNTEANGKYSHAEGWKTKAIGNQSHSEGAHSKANGQYAHAEGYNTIAEGQASHTSGYETEAKGKGEFAAGIWNKSGSDTQFSIGIGTSNTDRKNAFEVKQNGDAYIIGIGGYDGTNPTESRDLRSVIEPIIIEWDSIKDYANGEGLNNMAELPWLDKTMSGEYQKYNWAIQKDGIVHPCVVIPDLDSNCIQMLFFTRNEIEGTTGPLGNAIMKYSGLRMTTGWDDIYGDEYYKAIYKISNGGSLEVREFVFGENTNKNAYLLAAAQMSGIDTIDCKWVYTDTSGRITNVDAIFTVSNNSLVYIDGKGTLNNILFNNDGSYEKNSLNLLDRIYELEDIISQITIKMKE